MYEGGWKYGEKNGYGIFTSPEGIKYIGEYKNGIFNGQGIYNWQDGRKLEGIFKDGGIWNGKEYNKYGKVVGKYLNGVFHE